MTIPLRDGTFVDDPRLDRVRSATDEHLQKYPLTAGSMPAQETVQVFGTNFYDGMYEPVKRVIRGVERWYWPEASQLGRMVGGHAYALRPWGALDTTGWWSYYDQGVEGRCPEFSALRALTLHNRVRYDITSRWHYWQMQREDEWPGGSYPGATPQYEGSSVRAALEVLRKYGAIPARRRGASISPEEAPALVEPAQGIAAYRWVQSWDDARRIAGVPDWMDGIPMLNSWGQGFPHHTIVPDSTGERLLAEDGELGVITDR